VRTGFEAKDGKGPPASSPSPPPPSTGLVETEASVKAAAVYIHLVACRRPLEHPEEEEEEEDLTPLPSKLSRVETLQETLRLEREAADNRTDGEREQRHLQTPQISFFMRPTTSRSCLSLLHRITPLPNPSFSANISLCRHTLRWLADITAATDNAAITVCFFFFLLFFFLHHLTSSKLNQNPSNQSLRGKKKEIKEKKESSSGPPTTKEESHRATTLRYEKEKWEAAASEHAPTMSPRLPTNRERAALGAPPVFRKLLAMAVHMDHACTYISPISSSILTTNPILSSIYWMEIRSSSIPEIPTLVVSNQQPLHTSFFFKNQSLTGNKENGKKLKKPVIHTIIIYTRVFFSIL
jgi:hypothetical protein